MKQKYILKNILVYILFYYFVLGCSLLSVRANEPRKTIPIDNFYDTSGLLAVSIPGKDYPSIAKKVKDNLNIKLNPTFSKGYKIVLLTKSQIDSIEKLSIKLNVLQNPPFRYLVHDYNARYKRGYKDLKNLISEYKSYQLNQKLLKSLEKNFPALVTYRELGKTTMGFPIPAIRITTPNNNRNKVSILFNGGIHASELIGTEHCYDIIYQILTKPDDYKVALNNINIWIVPIINPDGSFLFWYKDNRMGRKNGYLHDSHSELDPNRGIDLNRNFPFKWNSGHPKASSANPSHSFFRGDEEGSEPETKAMMELAESERFLFSISFHSFATKLLFPYTIEGITNPDPDYPKELARKLAPLAKSYHPVKERFEAVKNIYPVDGTDQDFYYFKYGTNALLAESSHKNIDYSNVGTIMEGFRPVWQGILKECLNGYKIGLRILDREGDPIEAEIVSNEFKFYHQEKYTSDPETGLFYKMVAKEKEYKLKIVHPLYQDEYIYVKATKSLDPVVVQLKEVLTQ
jgi:hypothetical protein